MTKVSIRTCVGCGRRAEKSQLLRLGLRDGNIEVIPKRKIGQSGRGAYVHKAESCVAEMVRRGKQLERTLRLPKGSLNVEALRELVVLVSRLNED